MDFYFYSIRFSRELSRTTTRSLGASFHSDRESVGKLGVDGVEYTKPTYVSSKRLYAMIRPDWGYGLTGTIGALISGSTMPLFALGISQALVAYYMDWETTQHEVKKIAILFCFGAGISITVYAITHLCFGILAERLTLRVRQKMFSG